MNALVTGASRGIGYQLVKQLAGSGKVSRVFATARTEDKLKQLKKEAEHDQCEIIVLPLDLTSDFQSKLKDNIYSNGEKLDLLINNAGYLVNKKFEEQSEEEVFKQYEVNVLSVIRLTKTLLPVLKKANKPHIINISSMGGFQGSAKFPGLSSYSSSKAAVASLTECLAEEFKEIGISVNCLALGAVQTEMLEEAFPGYEAPLKDEEMAKFIADFALKAHHYINGKIIPVSLSTP